MRGERVFLEFMSGIVTGVLVFRLVEHRLKHDPALRMWRHFYLLDDECSDPDLDPFGGVSVVAQALGFGYELTSPRG